MARANCRGVPTQVFFPNDKTGVERAKRVCVGCPVRQCCLDYAVYHHIEYGVWGGTFEREQRVTRRQSPHGTSGAHRWLKGVLEHRAPSTWSTGSGGKRLPITRG